MEAAPLQRLASFDRCKKSGTRPRFSNLIVDPRFVPARYLFAGVFERGLALRPSLEKSQSTLIPAIALLLGLRIYHGLRIPW
jgi:hypothetical protein